MAAIDDIKTLLNDNWNSSNTDGETPLIDLIVNQKRVDLGISSAILIYQIDRSEYEVGIGAGHKEIKEYVSIDVRTTKSRDHLLLLYDEVERIIDENIKNTESWSFIRINTVKDLSDKSRKLWRYVIDVEMWIIAKER